MKKSILHEAIDITQGARAKAYGDAAENWQTTVDIFNAMTGYELTPAEGVKFAFAMKFARLKNSPDHHDSVVDLAGYSWVYSQVEK